MQVHPDVFRWLGVLGMMEGGKLTPPASKRTGKVAIPDDLSDQFENGQVRPSSLSARWLRDPGRGEILNAPYRASHALIVALLDPGSAVAPDRDLV